MFGFGIKRKCMHCEMELPLLSDTCTYCGQKQKSLFPSQQNSSSSNATSDFHTTDAPAIQAAPLPRPSIQTPAAQVVDAVRQVQAQKAKQLRAKAVAKEGCVVKILRAGLAFVWFFTIADLMDNFRSTQFGAGSFEEFTPAVSAGAAFLVIILSGNKILWRLVAIPLSLLNGTLLLMKPIQHPIVSTWQTADGVTGTHAFSYTSETHLFFVIPGAIVLFLGALNFLALLRAIWSRVTAWGR